MYVTRMLGRIPYQCFLPRPIVPEFSIDLRNNFKALEVKLIGLNSDNESYIEKSSIVIAQARNKFGSNDRGLNARESVLRFFETQHVGVSQLTKIHASLTGVKNRGLRNGLAWVGSQHPGTSWHVGSPPEQLNSLIKKLLTFDHNKLPSTLWATTAMLRILQIHPFADGNGRVARFYALWLLYKRMGPSTIAAEAINSLFDRSVLDLQSLSLHAQVSGDFNEIYKLVSTHIENSIRRS